MINDFPIPPLVRWIEEIVAICTAGVIVMGVQLFAIDPAYGETGQEIRSKAEIGDAKSQYSLGIMLLQWLRNCQGSGGSSKMVAESRRSRTSNGAIQSRSSVQKWLRSCEGLWGSCKMVQESRGPRTSNGAIQSRSSVTKMATEL